MIFIFISLITSQLTTANTHNAATDIINPKLVSISTWRLYNDSSQDEFLIKEYDTNSNKNNLSKTPYSLVSYNKSYKASFIIGWHHRTRELAISIGPLKGNDEIYINGFRVDKADNSSFDYIFENSYRVYRIPRNKVWFSWFNYAKENELIIKTSSSKNGQAIDLNQVEIGDYETLALKARDFDSTTKTIQGSAIAFIFILVLFTIFLRINKYENKSNELFGVFVFLISLSIGTTSLFLSGLPINDDFLLAISTGLDFLSIVIILRIASYKFNLNSFTAERAIEITGFIINIFLIFLSSNKNIQSYGGIIISIISIIIISLTIYQILTNNFIGLGANNSIFTALTIILLSTITNYFLGGNSWPLTPYHIGAILASIFLLYSIAQDFKKMTLSMYRLSSRLVNIREIERARLTRDIHDGVGQGLATIRLYISMNIDKFEPQLGASLKQEVDHTSNTLKSVIRNLKPIEIDDGNPTEALVQLARHLCEIAKIELKIANADEVDMSSESAYQLYRIGQEALNNSIKHSRGSLITIDIKKDHRTLKVTIADNGKGITKEVDDLGYGLSSMQERALLIRANLRVTNSMQGGTAVHLEVPIND